MIIFPAIDIKDGKVVRLLQGKFDQVTQYAPTPAAAAEEWQQAGAEWLHVIDLDGAKQGAVQNSDTIIAIAKAVKIPVQTGGGIRTKEDIARLLNGGVARVILGTKVTQDKNFLKEILAEWGNKIAVSLDCSNGIVLQKGWTAPTDLRAIDFAKELETMGLRCLIYTDVQRDGMLMGPNIDALKEILNAVKMDVIASGGISGLEDIKKLIALKNKNLIGVITGKALYEGKLDLKAALKIAQET